MADASSIASGVQAVLTATTRTYSLIVRFIRDYKEARADLTQMTRELSDLKLVLELIRDDNTDNADDATNPLPDVLQSAVQAMLTGCKTVVQRVEETLGKCRKKPGPLLWTASGKDKVMSFKVVLEAYKNSLNLALETISMFVPKFLNFLIPR